MKKHLLVVVASMSLVACGGDDTAATEPMPIPTLDPEPRVIPDAPLTQSNGIPRPPVREDRNVDRDDERADREAEQEARREARDEEEAAHRAEEEARRAEEEACREANRNRPEGAEKIDC